MQAPIVSSFNNHEKTYFLRINTFNYANIIGPSLENFFKKRFDTLFADINSKKTKDLIIDVRGNAGGTISIAGLLLTYLHDSSFTEVYHSSIVPQKSIPIEGLKLVNNIPIKSVGDAKKALQGVYNFTSNKDGDLLRVNYLLNRTPAQNRYSGNVYLVIDGGTFSAATYFAAIFKAYRKSLVVGSPTGGSIEKMTAGNMLQYQFPNTEIYVTVPLMNTTFSKDLYSRLTDTFITPHLTLSFHDKYKNFLLKRDWEMQTILEKIQREKN